MRYARRVLFQHSSKLINHNNIMKKSKMTISQKFIIFITVLLVIFVIDGQTSVKASKAMDFRMSPPISRTIESYKIKDYQAEINLAEHNINCITSDTDNSNSSDCLPPQAVTDFTAKSVRSHILVSWKTKRGLSNIGFNLYRGTDSETPNTALNNDLISPQSMGKNQDLIYEWKDTNVEVGTSYYYWLENVDQNDSRTLHGPVIVLHQSPTAVKVSEIKSFSSKSHWHWVIGIGLFGITTFTLATGIKKRFGGEGDEGKGG